MMEVEIVKELLIPGILLLVGASFSGAAAVAWWGVRRMVAGQDKMNDTLDCIRNELSEAMERVGKLETREEMREAAQLERHQENQRAILVMQDDIRTLQQIRQRKR